MKLYKDFIFKHIKDTKYPLWALYLVQNYRRVPLAFYNGDDFVEDEKIEGKTEKACIRLASTLQDFPADAVLSIDLKNAKTANGSGILGPFEFVNVSKEDAQINAMPGSNFANVPGLIGLPAAPAGYVSEETLNGKLEALRVENEKRINDIIFKQREKDFEEKMERERQELKDLRKELNDEKKKYESNTGAAAETLIFALKKIAAEFFPQLKQQAAPAAALQGVNTPKEQAPTVDPTDGKYKAVEELATRLYDNPNIKESDIRDMLTRMDAPAANVEQKKAEV